MLYDPHWRVSRLMALSKRQSNRLASLLAAMGGEEVPQPYQDDCVADGLLARAYNGRLMLTERGLDEKNRLCTLAGLNIKYRSEIEKNAQAKTATSVRTGNHGSADEKGATGST